MSPPKKLVPQRWERQGTETTNPTTTTKSDTEQNTRFDDLAARGRRHAAKLRSTVISTCSCIRDGDVDRHRCGDEITDKMSDAAVTAARHLELLGTPGLFDDRTCRAMYKQGHRALAHKCFRYGHGEAA